MSDASQIVYVFTQMENLKLMYLNLAEDPEQRELMKDLMIELIGKLPGLPEHAAEC